MVQSSSLKIRALLLWLQFLWLPDTTPHLQVEHAVQVASPVGRLRAKAQKQSGFSAPLPIRIKIWIPKESSVLSEAEMERLEPAVSATVSTVANILSVNRVPGRLLLSRDIKKFCRFVWRNASVLNYNRCGRANENYRAETCLDVTIPDEHLSGCAVYPHPDSPSMVVLRPEGTGLPDTDFVLYLYAQSTDKCHADNSVLAYAVHCQTDQNGRPLAGVVVICKDWLRGNGYSHDKTVQMLVHELFHVLGFSKQLFALWKDCSSSPQFGQGCSPWGQVINTDSNGQVKIYTRSVIQAMQTHLGSSNAELGGPLEILGANMYSSHWEARVLQGSIMMAALGNPELVRIDPVTLAALEDTGWYQVNQSAAQNLEWGKGQGEQFGSLTTCGDNSSTFFCLGSGFGCHHLHLNKGECQTDEYLEGCQIYKPSFNASECWKPENGRATEWSEEIFGPDSRCFVSTLQRQNVSISPGSSLQGRCYRHHCTGRNQYQVQVFGSDWMDCPAGTSIQVLGYRGSVLCPDKILCHHSYLAQLTSFPAPPHAGLPTNDSSLHKRYRTSATGFHPGSPQPSVEWILSSAEGPVVTVLGGGASVCLAAAFLAALFLVYRKIHCSRVQVHPVTHTATA